ncbi:hypothetical protein BDZ90DRAFT_231193 [Jaminaea rosea]|uniref:Nucleoporin protein Ndc1-Nup n=1 Tax=Jaminaea rosea TaxID=1569628 RepID=A0A316UVF4_9BASI|nr:hypothetical protein BDZ90DRAFT_231193 [Jaminaea rosea]PWN29212.1 hypothetical protein BDZ90DRAFT_231193 [Jaminaea rosea]
MATSAAPPAPAALGSRWSDLVKSSLHPRLLRLPLLVFALEHTLAAATHLPRVLGRGKLLDVILLPIRPDIALASLLAFTLGALPLLVIRRRILARTKWHQALVNPHPAPFASPASLFTSRPSPTALRGAISYLSHPATWLSALLYGLSSFLFTLPLLVSFALTSPTPATWLPYQQVPSVRKVSTNSGTFGGLRSHTTTTMYWRPNELVFALLLQPFFVGVVASLAAGLFSNWPSPPLRIPLFPFVETVQAIEAGAAGTASAGGTSPLATRITSSVPLQVVITGVHYAALSTILLTLYLPLRLPLFRLILLLLPPYSTLRRLIIPSLQPGYALLPSAGNLAVLFGNAALLAARLGMVQALAANLWEIYATHPLGIVSGGSAAVIMAGPTKPAAGSIAPPNTAAAASGTATLLEALEVFSPHSPLKARASTSYGEQERHFLFMHALLDLAALAQNLAAEGDGADKGKRGQFWKHFAVPAIAAVEAGAAGGMGAGTTVSAWERVSEVGLREVRAILEERKKAAAGVPMKPAAPSTSSSGGATGGGQSATTSMALEPASKALKAAPASAPASTSVTSSSAMAQQQARPAASATASTSAINAPPTTIWQRLVSTSATSAPSASTTSSQSIAMAQRPTASAPTAAPSTATQSPLASLIRRFLPPSPSTPSAFASSSSAPLTLLLLVPYIAQTLLLLSLHEDEWGSVTLSERKGLGVEAWQKVAGEIAAAVPADADGEEWGVLKEETKRRAEIVGREFGLIKL